MIDIAKVRPRSASPAKRILARQAATWHATLESNPPTEPSFDAADPDDWDCDCVVNAETEMIVICECARFRLNYYYRFFLSYCM